MQERHRSGRRTHKLRALLLAALACASGAVQAQAVVNDPPHTVKTVMGWIQAHAQDVKELKQWHDQMQHYHQQLVKAINLVDTSMPMTLEVEERDLGFGMSDRCRNPDGAPGTLPSLAQLKRKVMPDLDGDIPAEQYRICQLIVVAENARYNEQVRMMEYVRLRDRELRIITARGLLVDSNGAMDTFKAELSQYAARSSMDLGYYETALRAYDGLIDSFHKDQGELAAQALRGKGGTLIGTVVQGAALKTALESARARDR